MAVINCTGFVDFAGRKGEGLEIQDEWGAWVVLPWAACEEEGRCTRGSSSGLRLAWPSKHVAKSGSPKSILRMENAQGETADNRQGTIP